jgi:hypothetical protein
MFRLIDKTKDYTIIELPAAARTLKMMGVNIKRGHGLAAYPKWLQLPFTQVIVRPARPVEERVFVTQSADPIKSYESLVSFPILPNIYRDFHICTGELPDYTIKTIVDSFYLYDWQVVDMWSCAKVIQNVFDADTPQNGLRNWEKLSKTSPNFVLDLLRHNKSSHARFRDIVDGKIGLDTKTGKIEPMENMKPLESPQTPQPAMAKKKLNDDYDPFYDRNYKPEVNDAWGQNKVYEPAKAAPPPKKVTKVGKKYYGIRDDDYYNP